MQEIYNGLRRDAEDVEGVRADVQKGEGLRILKSERQTERS